MGKSVVTFVKRRDLQIRLTISWWMGEWWFIYSERTPLDLGLSFSNWWALFSLGLPLCTLHLVAAVGWWQLPDRSQCLTHGSPRPSSGAKLLGGESNVTGGLYIAERTPFDSGLSFSNWWALFSLGLPLCTLQCQKTISEVCLMTSLETQNPPPMSRGLFPGTN